MLETLINPGYACEGYAVKARQDVQDLLVSLACRPAWQQMLRSNTRWTHCQRQRHGPREIPYRALPHVQLGLGDLRARQRSVALSRTAAGRSNPHGDPQKKRPATAGP